MIKRKRATLDWAALWLETESETDTDRAAGGDQASRSAEAAKSKCEYSLASIGESTKGEIGRVDLLCCCCGGQRKPQQVEEKAAGGENQLAISIGNVVGATSRSSIRSSIFVRAQPAYRLNSTGNFVDCRAQREAKSIGGFWLRDLCHQSCQVTTRVESRQLQVALKESCENSSSTCYYPTFATAFLPA